MDLDKLILIFGYFLIFIKSTPVLADGTHGHALSVSNVQSLEIGDPKESHTEENMEIHNQDLKVQHHVGKILTLDIVQYVEADIILGTSPDEYINFDLQTSSHYNFQEPSVFLQSSTAQTDQDIYIKLLITEDPIRYTDSVITAMFVGFCLLVLLSKLMNYKSKFKLEKEEEMVFPNEESTGLMWNLRHLDEFFWKRKREKIIQIKDITEKDEDYCENYEKTNRRLEKGNGYHIDDNCQNYTNKMRYSTTTKNRKWNWTVCVGIILIVSVVTVFAMKNFKQKHVLKVDIPERAIIRKIRSYSENPDLSAISLNSSSMSLVMRLQLLKTSCLTYKSSCETYAVCDTEQGHMTCRCKRGFYVKDRKCKECATSCREGYFMSKACTASSDVICRPCSSCTGASYEVAHCSSTQDTICIGAAFPVPNVKWNKLLQHTNNTSISMSASKNVFYEKISGIKQLDSSMYIPNNAQVQEFVFQREAGLHIKIKVSNLYLVPQYIDLDHEDDFMFINQDATQLESSKEQYRSIKRKYCRHQLPDRYKIILYITRNHTSAAREVTCNSHDPDVPQCPAGYKDGYKYLERHINTECPHKTSDEKNQYFERFQQRTNNIFCTHTTKLFTETFGLTPEEMSNYTFPSPDCQSSAETCRHCLMTPKCKSYEGQCCDINCYTDSSCQKAYSDTCPQKHVECASGDVHNFVLEPIFSSIDNRFMCHMQYKQPSHLYQIDYTVYMPKIDYTLRKRTKFAKGDKSFNEKGVFTSEFITATHNAFPTINDEVILIGSNYKDKNPTQFWIHELKKPHQFNKRKKFKIRPHRATSMSSSNIYSTHIQVEKPFLYSTSVFYKGGCFEKNFTNIYPPQSIYLDNGIEVDPSITKTGAGFEYQMANNKRPAYIRVSIDNSSILSHFQEDIGKTSVEENSLSGGLYWNDWTTTWLIVVEGKLKSCPGYMTVDLYDQFMDAKIDSFDIFVKCPVDFQLNIDLKPPNTDLPNILVACLNDSFVSHYILLTSMQPPVYPPTEYALTITNGSTYQFPWIPIIIILIFTAIIFSAFVVAFLVFHRMTPIRSHEVKKTISPDTTTYIGAKDDDRNVDQPLTLTLFSKPVSKGVSCTLCVLYIAYAIIFTFSMLLAVLYIVQGPLVSNLTIVSNTSAKIHQSVGNHMTKISQFEDKELKSAFNQTFDRMKACSVHIRQNMDKVENLLEKDLKDILNTFYDNHGSLRLVVNSSLSEKSKLISEKLEKFLNEAETMLSGHFSHIQENYVLLLEKFRDNEWIHFPKDRFSDQQFIAGQEETFQGLKDFMKWLELDGVETVLNIKEIIMNRLRKSVKELIPSKAQLSSSFSTVPAPQDPLVKLGQNSKFGFQILEPPEARWMFENFSDSGDQNSDKPMSNTIKSKAKMIDRMREIILPVFICFFLLMDALMLLYRFVWLRKILKKAKLGLDVKVPTDNVAEKIQFWQTGENNRKLEKPTENPYNFYSDNKDDMWSGKNDPIQLYANTAQKSKQEILREIWNKKQKQKRLSYIETKHHSLLFKTICRLSTFFYKHLIAPILWRFVLVGAFVLVICLVTKATSDLVTIETAKFLIDTKSIIPQLHRQVDITNNLLLDVTVDLNKILKQHKSLVDLEVATMNDFLMKTVDSLNAVLHTILKDLCAMGSEEFCKPTFLRVQDLVTSCNFLPVTTSPFKEMDEGLFVHYLHSELVPLVSTLRQILFNTCYILFVYACLMLICHTFIRLIIFYLIKTSRLPKSMIYLVSNTNDCWKGNEGSATKSMYRSNSCIESCESGVVGDFEDHRESNM